MGPVATQMLGDYGADVIKIERPPTGDLSRTSFPDDPAGLVGPVFCSLNRNKRSRRARPAQAPRIAPRVMDADRRRRRGREQFPRRRDGAHGPRLRRAAARSIRASSTRSAPASASTGPYAHKGGQDVLAQAMSGVMARRSDDDRCRSPSTPRPSPTTRPACTWCRASCSRCCSGEKTGRGPAVQRLAAQLDARRADPGGGDAS